MRMKINKLGISFTLILILINFSEAIPKRGGGGFSRGSSSSRGSSGSGWFSSSRSSPSYSRPSPSYSSPSYSRPSPSYTYSAPSPSYGWNVGSGSTVSKPAGTSYSWNVGSNSASKPSAPLGAPPAYPGLQNRHVPSNNAPPAYSPSYRNPPSYSPSYHSPSYNSRPSTYYSSNPGYYQNPNSYYGSTFGSHGLGGNTYISNNYYGNQRSGSSGFLTNALFYGAGTHHGYSWGHHSSYDSHRYGYGRRRWDEDEDRRWRATTQGPYFENKVPGEDKILPASAVIGAATAFGLASLLPLNVPSNKPLMYCNNETDLMQAQIRINNKNIYHCINGTLHVLCPIELVKNNATENSVNVTVPQIENQCVNKTMQCDLDDHEISGNIYCKSGTLFSKIFTFCNSTSNLNGTNLNGTSPILYCYDGELPEHIASFVPTTTTTQAPTTTTQKSLSFGAQAHIFFLNLIGKGDILEKTTTMSPPSSDIQGVLLSSDNETWIPQALTIPPETTTVSTTTTTTTEPPFIWMERSLVNGHFNETFAKPVPQTMVDLVESFNKDVKRYKSVQPLPYPVHWFKKYITTESTTQSQVANDTTTEFSLTTEAVTPEESSTVKVKETAAELAFKEGLEAVQALWSNLPKDD